MKPDPEEALADALAEVCKLVVAMGDPRADRAELEARLRGSDQQHAVPEHVIRESRLDYLFLFQVQEALNPGSLKRMERCVQKENGRRS